MSIQLFNLAWRLLLSSHLNEWIGFFHSSKMFIFSYLKLKDTCLYWVSSSRVDRWVVFNWLTKAGLETTDDGDNNVSWSLLVILTFQSNIQPWRPCTPRALRLWRLDSVLLLLINTLHLVGCKYGSSIEVKGGWILNGWYYVTFEKNILEDK